MRVYLHDRAHDAHRPTLQSHDLKQSIGTITQCTGPVGKLRAEKFGGHHCKNIQNHCDNANHRAQTGNGCKQSCGNPPHARYQRNDPHHAQYTQRTQGRKRTADRYECDNNYREIKNTSGTPGEIPAMTNNPGSDLSGKDAEQRLVGQSQRLPPPGLD